MPCVARAGLSSVFFGQCLIDLQFHRHEGRYTVQLIISTEDVAEMIARMEEAEVVDILGAVIL